MLSIFSCAFSAICMAQTTRGGLTLFSLPLTSCCSLLQSSLCVPAGLPAGEEASLSVGTSPLLQFPIQGCRVCLTPFFSFFHPDQVVWVFSCPFKCLKSSTSVQQVLCENYSICRCLLDAFMWRDVLLSPRPTPSPLWTVCYTQGIVRDTWDPTVMQTENDAPRGNVFKS